MISKEAMDTAKIRFPYIIIGDEYLVYDDTNPDMRSRGRELYVELRCIKCDNRFKAVLGYKWNPRMAERAGFHEDTIFTSTMEAMARHVAGRVAFGYVPVKAGDPEANTDSKTHCVTCSGGRGIINTG